MLVRDVVNPNTVKIKLGTTVREAAETLRQSQASDLMVVGDNDQFIGVLSEGDLLRACLPNVQAVFDAGGKEFAEDLFNDKAKSVSLGLIDSHVLRQVITLKPTDKVNIAAGKMISNMIRRLPVVENGKLLGSVSRADIARAVLAD